MLFWLSGSGSETWMPGSLSGHRLVEPLRTVTMAEVPAQRVDGSLDSQALFHSESQPF